MGAKMLLRQVMTRPGICDFYHTQHAEARLLNVGGIRYNSAK